MPEATWLDVMPAIPLARGVPIVNSRSERCIVTKIHKEGWWFADGSVNLAHDDRDQVDLNDPQGFGYVLRWVWHHDGHADSLRSARLWRLLHQWTDDETTDDDRLALAKACAEVVNAQ